MQETIVTINSTGWYTTPYPNPEYQYWYPDYYWYLPYDYYHYYYPPAIYCPYCGKKLEAHKCGE